MVEGFSGRYPPDSDHRKLRRQVGTRRVGKAPRIAHRRVLGVVMTLVVAGALIFVASSRLPKRYSSVAWIRVAPPAVVTKGASVDLAKEQRAAVQAFVSPRLTADLRKRFGARLDDVASLVPTGILASPLIRIDSQASTAALATQVADRSANFVVNDLQNRARAKAAAKAKLESAALAGLDANVVDLATQITSVPISAPPYPALKAKLDAATLYLRDAAAVVATDTLQARIADGGLELYGQATRPAGPDFPNPVSWTIIGDLAILLILVGLLFGREELRGRFENGGASESRRSGTMVLGVLPTSTGRFPPGTAIGAGTTVDETALQLVHLLGRAGPKIVLMCDADGAAPEATARRVAQSVAASGVRVVFAVCRSLSMPDDLDAADVLPTVSELEAGRGAARPRDQLLVADGGIAINELTADRARTVLRRLADLGDYIVLVSPSPMVEPGSLVLAQLADVSVLVARHGVTRLRDAERTSTRLRRVGGTVFGVLVDPAPDWQPPADPQYRVTAADVTAVAVER